MKKHLGSWDKPFSELEPSQFIMGVDYLCVQAYKEYLFYYKDEYGRKFNYKRIYVGSDKPLKYWSILDDISGVLDKLQRIGLVGPYLKDSSILYKIPYYENYLKSIDNFSYIKSNVLFCNIFMYEILRISPSRFTRSSNRRNDLSGFYRFVKLNKIYLLDSLKKENVKGYKIYI